MYKEVQNLCMSCFLQFTIYETDSTGDYSENEVKDISYQFVIYVKL